jgi:hypothetical protein
LFPSRRRRLAPAASLVRPSALGIRSLVEFGNRQSAPSPSSALPPRESYLTHGCTSMHFGENQLSPGSISISPLSTRHPPVLQHWWVRASTRSYPRFTLRMDSSPGFGSGDGNSYLSIRALFRLAFAPAPRLYRRLTCPPRALARRSVAAAINSSDHSTKGTPLDSPTRVNPAGGTSSDCLSALGFRVSFIPLSGCFSPFPHGTRSLSVAREYLALEGGPPCFPQDFPCPVVLRLHISLPVPAVEYGALTRYGAVSHRLPLTQRLSRQKAPLPFTRGDDARLQPRHTRRRAGLGWSRFARHYSGSLLR